MAVVDFTAFMTPTADELDSLPKGTIAWGQRSGQKTGISTESGALMVEDVTIYAGRLYEIKTQDGLILDSTVTTDVLGVRLRYTTDGSTPTTASTLLTQTVCLPQRTAPCGEFYRPLVNEVLSVIVTAARLAGTTGTITIPATNPIVGGFQSLKLFIVDHGFVPSASGTSL